MPNTILGLSYCTLRDIIVVSVPAPANNGNANGTILPDASSPTSSDRKKRIPNIISNPIKNITNDPANANEEISIPNNPKIADPKNKKLIMMMAVTIVVVEGSILRPSFFILIIIGTFPIISMTENRITETEIIAPIFISYIF